MTQMKCHFGSRIEVDWRKDCIAFLYGKVPFTTVIYRRYQIE